MATASKLNTKPRGAAPIGGHVAVYGVGNAVVAALNFALFPIYARALEPSDYGAISLISTVCSAVAMLGLMGMNNAVQRFFFDEPDLEAQHRIWSTGLLSAGAFTALAVVAAVGFCAAIQSHQPALSGWPAMLALATILPQVVVSWLQDQARLQFHPLRFTMITIAQALIAGGAGILFVAVWHWQLPGFFAAGLVAAGLTAVGAIATAPWFWPLNFSRREFGRLIRFGAPFVPAGVFIWSSTAVLRWMLADARSLDEAGHFDVAWKLAAPVWMLNVAVGQVFGPYAFRLRAGDPGYRTKLVEAFHGITTVTLIVAATIALFAREICDWLAPSTYGPAAGPCAILALAFYFSATHQVTALGIAFAEKSHLIASGWGAAALAAAGLALWLVPAAGASGAACCVVVAYAGLTLFYLFWGQRLHPLPFRVGPIAIQFAIGAAVVATALRLQHEPISIAVVLAKTGCLLAAAGAAVRWGGVEPRRLLAMCTSMVARARAPGADRCE